MASLNVMTLSMAYEVKNSSAQVFAVTPGFTSTDLNGNAAGGKSKEAAAALILVMRQMANVITANSWMRRVFTPGNPQQPNTKTLADHIAGKSFLHSRF
ncbi:hypothetical protein [Paenibacillus sp. FSL H8-0034]|uniref:hypothetical protein n=1 Tax=Paenibacillus sp. FSL H8-0034 TaxID=2954671 RepID=UPI0030F58C39